MLLCVLQSICEGDDVDGEDDEDKEGNDIGGAEDEDEDGKDEEKG